MLQYTMTVLENPDSDGHRYFADWIEIDRHHEPDFEAVEAWCTREFGAGAVVGQCQGSRWAGESSFWFRDKDDAMLFKIRWC